MSKELTEEVGETAGKVWHLLSEAGPQTVTQLRKKVDASSDLISFGLGWLAREDKIRISLDRRTVRVELKQ